MCIRDRPVAATVLSQDNMRANQVNSVKNLTGIAVSYTHLSLRGKVFNQVNSLKDILQFVQ